MTTRRDFLKTAAIAGGVAAGFPAVIRQSFAAEPVVVLTGFGFLPNFIEIMNASSGGHFKKAGLDAKVIGAHGTAQEMQEIVAGQAQFGRVGSLDLMQAVSRQSVPLVS